MYPFPLYLVTLFKGFFLLCITVIFHHANNNNNKETKLPNLLRLWLLRRAYHNLLSYSSWLHRSLHLSWTLDTRRKGLHLKAVCVRARVQIPYPIGENWDSLLESTV